MVRGVPCDTWRAMRSVVLRCGVWSHLFVRSCCQGEQRHVGDELTQLRLQGSEGGGQRAGQGGHSRGGQGGQGVRAGRPQQGSRRAGGQGRAGQSTARRGRVGRWAGTGGWGQER